jgi:GntR family transcriptional regulator
MFQIDQMSRKPIYEQIIEQTERFVMTGLLKQGEQIPSVRCLSMELSINPNTIQKAYSELDLRGVIHSVPGKGCFVCNDAINILAEYKRNKLFELSQIISDMAIAGVAKEEIIQCVEDAFLGKAK